ncbi:hypothetical protein HDV05_003217, partial [Chytridiales sp. JEL 0842]
DVVNLAARLLSIPSPDANVRCDKASYSITREDFGFIDLGFHKVKGKTDAINVWAALPKSTSVNPIDSGSTGAKLFGYIKERSAIFDSIETWRSLGSQVRVVIEGKSGMGKSRLIDFATS